jgi:hypothetical protein
MEEEDPQTAYNLFADTFLNLYNLQFPLKEIKKITRKRTLDHKRPFDFTLGKNSSI